MTDINLLPWREKKREREKKQFMIYMIMAIIGALTIVYLMNFYANQLIERQSARNQILEQEITRLKRQIKEIDSLKQLRQALIARMTIIQNLQAARTLTVHLFDELVQIIPKGVYLTMMERKGNAVMISGYAESNSDVSQVLRKIEDSVWLQHPTLTEINKSETPIGEVQNQFKLNFLLSPIIQWPGL